MNLWHMPALVMVMGYIIGSIPFGILLTRAFGAGDLRAIGSGNIGATNVLRTGRKGLAAATLVLDLLKGAVAVWLGVRLLGHDPLVHGGAMAGVMAFIGHCYPVWLRFRGGKGVATMMGVCVALIWQVGLIFAVMWLGILAISRISSAGGICAGLSAPLACLALGRLDLFAPVAAMALILLWRHRDNIARLLKGQEPRIGGSRE